MSPLMQAALFILDTGFTFLMLAVLLRILLQAIRADFYNPICQMVLKISNYFVLPLRRIIPAYYGIDWACVVALLILAFLKQGLLVLLQTGLWVNPLGLLLLGIADILGLVFYIYIFALIVIVVVSWLNPNTNNPIIPLATQLIAPIQNKIRTLLPSAGGFDLSPLVLTVLLILFNMLVIQVIANQGIALIIP